MNLSVSNAISTAKGGGSIRSGFDRTLENRLISSGLSWAIGTSKAIPAYDRNGLILAVNQSCAAVCKQSRSRQSPGRDSGCVAFFAGPGEAGSVWQLLERHVTACLALRVPTAKLPIRWSPQQGGCLRCARGAGVQGQRPCGSNALRRENTTLHGTPPTSGRGHVAGLTAAPTRVLLVRVWPWYRPYRRSSSLPQLR